MPDRRPNESCCRRPAFVATRWCPNSGTVGQRFERRLSWREPWHRSRRGACSRFRWPRFVCAAGSSPAGRRLAAWHWPARRIGRKLTRRMSALKNSAMRSLVAKDRSAVSNLAAMCSLALQEAARRPSLIGPRLAMIAPLRMQGRSLRSRSCVRARSFRHPLRSLFDFKPTMAAQNEPRIGPHCRGKHQK
jgi:hypothetical protein